MTDTDRHSPFDPATSPGVPQIRFPGQAAAPPGPVDVRMMYLMHHAFRRDLEVLAAATKATPTTDGQTWSALASRWDFFSRQLEHHHRGEDAGLWPLLMANADAAEQAMLADMEAEHALIDPLLEDCRERFAAIAAGSDNENAGRDLSERLLAARACLGDHLRHEESDAMAMVQRRLTQKQWDQMAKESFGADQTFRDLLATLPWAMHRMPQEQADDMFRFAGKPFKLLWWITRGRFERREALLTRYVPQPAGRG